jgi:hypothetical protein
MIEIFRRADSFLPFLLGECLRAENIKIYMKQNKNANSYYNIVRILIYYSETNNTLSNKKFNCQWNCNAKYFRTSSAIKYATSLRTISIFRTIKMQNANKYNYCAYLLIELCVEIFIKYLHSLHTN